MSLDLPPGNLQPGPFTRPPASGVEPMEIEKMNSLAASRVPPPIYVEEEEDDDELAQYLEALRPPSKPAAQLRSATTSSKMFGSASLPQVFAASASTEAMEVEDAHALSRYRTEQPFTATPEGCDDCDEWYRNKRALFQETVLGRMNCVPEYCGEGFNDGPPPLKPVVLQVPRNLDSAVRPITRQQVSLVAQSVLPRFSPFEED